MWKSEQVEQTLKEMLGGVDRGLFIILGHCTMCTDSHVRLGDFRDEKGETEFT